MGLPLVEEYLKHPVESPVLKRDIDTLKQFIRSATASGEITRKEMFDYLGGLDKKLYGVGVAIVVALGWFNKLMAHGWKEDLYIYPDRALTIVRTREVCEKFNNWAYSTPYDVGNKIPLEFLRNLGLRLRDDLKNKSTEIWTSYSNLRKYLLLARVYEKVKFEDIAPFIDIVRFMETKYYEIYLDVINPMLTGASSAFTTKADTKEIAKALGDLFCARLVSVEHHKAEVPKVKEALEKGLQSGLLTKGQETLWSDVVNIATRHIDAVAITPASFIELFAVCDDNKDYSPLYFHPFKLWESSLNLARDYCSLITNTFLRQEVLETRLWWRTEFMEEEDKRREYNSYIFLLKILFTAKVISQDEYFMYKRKGEEVFK